MASDQRIALVWIVKSVTYQSPFLLAGLVSVRCPRQAIVRISGVGVKCRSKTQHCDKSGTFSPNRVIYLATFDEAIYILSGFSKKSQKTAKSDIEKAKSRLAALHDYRRTL